MNTILDNMAQKNTNNESKDADFQVLIQQLNAVEQKWLIRILLKDLRLGLQQKKIFTGLIIFLLYIAETVTNLFILQVNTKEIRCS